MTEGAGSHGIVADHWSAAINAGIFAGILPGTINTSGVWAYGMWAHDWAAAVNAGTIGTSGDRSHGMVAEKGSLAVNFGLGSDVSGFLGDIIGGLGDFDLGEFSDYLDMFGDLLGDGILPGKIETEGDDAHGMVARNWAAAINLSEIATLGEESYGMHAEDFGLALNMGDIATEKYGSHGMVAEEGSIAVNAGSLLSLGSGLFDLIPGDFFEGIFGDEGGVGQIADGLVGILGSLFGGGSSTIETWGPGAHGMVARNWSAAMTSCAGKPLRALAGAMASRRSTRLRSASMACPASMFSASQPCTVATKVAGASARALPAWQGARHARRRPRDRHRLLGRPHVVRPRLRCRRARPAPR